MDLHENDRKQIEAKAAALEDLNVAADLLKTGAMLPSRHLVEKAAVMAKRAAEHIADLHMLMLEMECD